MNSATHVFYLSSTSPRATSRCARTTNIGSGYGAVTHSLSRSVRDVYFVEAMPERIEFTQERLRHEDLTNVRLIQASATALPLVENGFGVVVTNSVLRVCSSPRGRNQALTRAVFDPHGSSETRCKRFLP